MDQDQLPELQLDQRIKLHKETDVKTSDKFVGSSYLKVADTHIHN